jgi:integrase
MTPYFYSEEEIASLARAAARIRSAHRAATYRTLISLLAITGMRVGEAIGLDLSDFDARSGLLTIRNAKFGKSRELPLHASAVDALRRHLKRRNQLRSAASSPALFVSTTGTRLCYNNVQCTFHRLVRHVGLEPRSGSCRPRLHDLRHSFAVRTLLEGYRQGGDTGARLALLSTYLGHVNPAGTYWYLSAAPELMDLAGARLERYLGGES